MDLLTILFGYCVFKSISKETQSCDFKDNYDYEDNNDSDDCNFD